jgi:hypothetical protein
LIRDCEDRHRGNSACGKWPLPALAVRYRAYYLAATYPLRDGGCAKPMHGVGPMRLRVRR